MRLTGMLLGFFALALLLMPALTAQEKKKKNDAKAEKAEKADKTDKTDKKDPDKTDTEKPEKPAKKKKEEKLEHGPVVTTKILSMKADSAHDFTIEVPVPDPQQIQQLQLQSQQLKFWQMQQMQQLAMTRNPVQYAQRMQSYQLQLMQRQQQMAQKQAQGYGYKMTPVDVRATETCKVRSLNPPVQYDDEGKLKKYTQKELKALKGKSKLPGYESSFESLKVGQVVEIYHAKQHGSPKEKWAGGKTQKKKKVDDDPPPEPMAEQRPEVVMIVIKFEPMGR